jgi:hypothetical protein
MTAEQQDSSPAECGFRLPPVLCGAAAAGGATGPAAAMAVLASARFSGTGPAAEPLVRHLMDACLWMSPVMAILCMALAAAFWLSLGMAPGQRQSGPAAAPELGLATCLCPSGQIPA